MREILFRGKRIEDGKWIYGYYLDGKTSTADFPCIALFRGDAYDDDNDWEVDIETVGQFTGMTDKNGTKIFAGDIVKTKYGRLCEVRWFSAPCFQCWDLIPIENKHKIPDEYDLWIPKNLEVIGNIHDNFELLNK